MFIYQRVFLIWRFPKIQHFVHHSFEKLLVSIKKKNIQRLGPMLRETLTLINTIQLLLYHPSIDIIYH